jgi:hypothetical protein
MATYLDFSIGRLEDAVLTVSMTPPTNISGKMIRFMAQHRFGGISGFATKYAASGFNNVSGINVIDGVQGRFQISLNSVDSSGLDYGNYATASEFLDPGQRTIVTEGYMAITPGVAT